MSLSIPKLIQPAMLTPEHKPADCADFANRRTTLATYAESQKTAADAIRCAVSECFNLGCPLRNICDEEAVK
ncbi:hypothetical protein KJ742_05860 [Patescibacteria group bacterium]|nr:hypothetical protein [Patescibacteria group bacterium]MBU1683441.1 hypothetical protein [Patescibacteria group bacterium]MBU1934987.1 hypothetical protein [Patescibacteria group bacterium]